MHVLVHLALAGLVVASYGHLPDVARAHGVRLPATQLTVLLLLSVIGNRVIQARRAARASGASLPVALGAATKGLPRALVPLLAYGLVVGAGVLYASDPAPAVESTKRFVVSTVLLLTTILLVTSRRSLRVAAWAVVSTALVLCAVNLFQHVTERFGSDFFGLARPVVDPWTSMPRCEPPKTVPGRTSARIGGPFGDPNYFAQRLVVAVPLAVWLLRTSRSLILQLGALATAAACGAAIAVSGSRGGILALLIVSVMMIHGLVPRERRAIVWLVPVLVCSLLLLPEPTRARLLSIPSAAWSLIASDQEPTGRAREWRVAAAMYGDHPLIGVGAGNFPTRYLGYADQIGADLRPQARSPHNVILEAAAETGLLGVAGLGALVVTAFEALRRARRRLGESARSPGLVEAFRASLAGYGTAAMFLGLVYTDLPSVLLGIAFGCWQLEGSRPETPA